MSTPSHGLCWIVHGICTHDMHAMQGSARYDCGDDGDAGEEGVTPPPYVDPFFSKTHLMKPEGGGLPACMQHLLGRQRGGGR